MLRVEMQEPSSPACPPGRTHTSSSSLERFECVGGSGRLRESGEERGFLLGRGTGPAVLFWECSKGFGLWKRKRRLYCMVV